MTARRTGAWVISLDGAGPIGAYDTRARAIKLGRELALETQPSSLAVYRADGSLQSEWVFGADTVAART